MSQLDWRVSAKRAAQLAPAGPTGSAGQLRGVVSSLRHAAEMAPPMVARITGLDAASKVAASRPVYVVDRARWAEANAQLFTKLAGEALGLAGPVQARLAAEQTGMMLAILSTRVLGQFDPYTTAGQLLLVAPNIMAIERQLDLDVMDFRLWVALHEQTHAVQFAAAPWLADHLTGSIGRLTAGLADVESGPERIKDAVRAVMDLARGKDRAVGVLQSLLKPSESAELDHVIGVMSLLEGHADVVMDEVGPSRIPSVHRIRASFERRRDGVGLLDTLVRRLTGMDDKIAQYRDGAAFVRTVVAYVGHEGLNKVWDRPENLPSREEIGQPERWVERVAR